MPQFKNILFDLDGTIMDTSEGITLGVEYAINKMGLKKLDMETKKRFIGPPLWLSFKKYCGISEEMAKQAVTEYRVYYSSKGVFECKPYDGMESLFKKLQAAGKTLCVATAKPIGFSLQILKHHGLYKYFKTVIGADIKKAPDSKDEIIADAIMETGKENTVMVGDTKFDILSAHANGIDSIGVLYGFGSTEELSQANPTFMVETVSELEELLLNG